MFRIDDNELIKVVDKFNKTVINSSKSNKSWNFIYISNIRATQKPIFLTSNVKKVFNNLKQVFIKASILQYFNWKSYIKIDTNVSSYAIDRVLNQLKLDSNISLNDLNLNKYDFGQ